MPEAKLVEILQCGLFPSTQRLILHFPAWTMRNLRQLVFQYENLEARLGNPHLAITKAARRFRSQLRKGTIAEGAFPGWSYRLMRLLHLWRSKTSLWRVTRAPRTGNSTAMSHQQLAWILKSKPALWSRAVIILSNTIFNIHFSSILQVKWSIRFLM